MLGRAVFAAIIVMLEAGGAEAQTAAPAPAPPPPATPAPASGTKAPAVSGIVVSAQRPAVKTSIDRTTYAVGDDPLAENGTAADVLRGLPSVDVDIDGNPSLRGDSGVQILLNGRPSSMLSGADRGAILQMMGADNIDSVEIITNPSARYSPDGSAGIINIVTKKNFRAGPNGVLRESVGAEGRYTLGAGGSFNAGPVNIHGNLSIRHDVRERFSETTRSYPDPTTGQRVDTDQISTSTGARNSANLYLGADYELTKTDVLTGEANLFQGGGPPRSTEHDISTLPASNVVRLGSGSDYDWSEEASARYTHNFPGLEHQFTLDVKVARNDDHGRRAYREVFTAPVQPDTADDQISRSRGLQQQVQAEYSRPLMGEAKLDVGYSLRRDDDLYFNGADFLNPMSGAATPNLAQTNQFAFVQTVHALFGTYQQPLGKWAVMAGMRVEQVFIDTDQQTSRLVDHTGYLRAYPSLHLQYPLTESQSFKLSYGLRINRPGAGDLNPFVVVQDPQNESAGNPRLTPQQTHALEATWQNQTPNATQSVTAYFRQTENALADVTRNVTPTLVLTTKGNLGRIRSVGFDFAANGKPSKTFSYTFNAYLFNNQTATSNVGFSGTRQQVSYSAKVNLNWRPTPKDLVQWSMNYNAERLTPQGYRKPNGGADIGYRHDLWDNLAAVFSVSDLFDSRDEKTIVETATVHDVALRQSSGRIAYAGLTWRLGGGRRRPQDDRLVN